MIKIIEMYRRMKEIYENGGELFIRGAGKVGRQANKELLELGLKVAGFIDRNPNGLPSTIDGTPIFSPEVINEKKQGSFFVLVAVAKDDLYFSIRNELMGKGLRELEDFGDFAIHSDGRMMSFRDIKPSLDAYGFFEYYANVRLQEMQEMKKEFSVSIGRPYNLIANLDLPLTTYCTLKCQYCSHGIPYEKQPKHFDCRQIMEDLEKLLSVSYVACLAIMGGEPFVYPELEEFVRLLAAVKYRENIGFIRVITNGTVIPKDGFFDAFRKLENAYIYISNYGSKSGKIEEIKQRCVKFGIPFFLCPQSSEWLLLGDFTYAREYTEEELGHLFMICDARACVQLFNGHLYSCARVPVLNENHIIPYTATDYCDVRSSSETSLREELHHYLYETSYLNGCKYCDGQHIYSRTVGRGE